MTSALIKPKVYRVQDDEGRGPFRPGFSARWLDWNRRFDLKTWYQEFPGLRFPPEFKWRGSAARDLEQLALWFSPQELDRLRAFGYSLVSLEVDQVVAESKIQLVVASRKPFWEIAQVV